MPRRRQDSSRSKRLGGLTPAKLIQRQKREVKVHSRHIDRRLLIEWTLVISGDIMKRYERPIPRIGFTSTSFNHDQNLTSKLFHYPLPSPKDATKVQYLAENMARHLCGNSWKVGWNMATSTAVTFLKLVSGPFFPMRLGFFRVDEHQKETSPGGLGRTCLGWMWSSSLYKVIWVSYWHN